MGRGERDRDALGIGSGIKESRASRWQRTYAVYHPSWIVCFVHVCITAACPVSSVADVTISPRLKETLAVDDNRGLSVDPEETVFGSITEFGLGVNKRGETWEGEFTPRARIGRYTGDQDFDIDEFFLETSVNRNFGRIEIAAGFDAMRESTLTSELTDSGLLFGNLDRDSLEFNSALRYAVTNTELLTVTFLYSDVSFEERPGSGFSDYTYFSPSISFSHQFSRETQWIANLTYSNFESTEVSNETDTVTFSFGMAHAFSETLSGSIAVGHIISDISFQDLLRLSDFGIPPPAGNLPVPDAGGNPQFIEREADDAGLYLSVTLEKQFERARFSGSFSRQVSPSSLGAQRTNDRGEAEYVYRIDEAKWRAFARLYWLSQESEAEIQPGLEREYLSVNLGLAYRVNKQWGLKFAYRRREQERGRGTVVDADSNALTLELNFTPGPFLANQIFN